jgi:hypothetical protein
VPRGPRLQGEDSSGTVLDRVAPGARFSLTAKAILAERSSAVPHHGVTRLSVSELPAPVSAVKAAFTSDQLFHGCVAHSVLARRAIARGDRSGSE